MRRSASALQSGSARPRILLVSAATAALAVLVVFATVFAATIPEVVRPSSLNGWFGYNDTTDTVDNSLASFVTGPGTAPAGTGSARLNAAEGERPLLAKNAFNGLPLGGVTTLSYSTYRSSFDAGNNLALSLQLGWDNDGTDGNTGFRGRLVFEPYFSAPGGVPQDTWQTWNTLTASSGWWTTMSGASLCTQSATCSWTQMKAAYPNASIHSNAALGFIGIRAGTTAIDGNVDNLIIGTFSNTYTYDFEPDIPCTTVCYVDDLTGSDNYGGTSAGFPKKTIQAAIDTVSSNGEIRILPGTYDETATGRGTDTDSGPNQFGLFFPPSKSGITLQGVTAGNIAITDAGATEATITTNATNTFGYSGVFVASDGVTIQGLSFGANAAGDEKTFEVIGDDFTLNASVIDSDGSLYIADWETRYDDNGTVGNFADDVSHIQSYTITNNIFDGTSSPYIANGAGVTGAKAGRVMTDNQFISPEPVSFAGPGAEAWLKYPVGGAVFEDNTFTSAAATRYIQAWGDFQLTGQFDWSDIFTLNTYPHAVVTTTDGNLDHIRPYTAGAFTDIYRVGAVIQNRVDNAQSGDTVIANSGTFTEQVVVDEDLHILGQGEGTTIIKAPASLVAGSDPGHYAIVDINGGADVEMSDLSVSGPGPSGCGSLHYGILVTGAAHLDAHDMTVADIRDNPLSGCQNGNGIQVGRQAISQTGTADIDNVTVTGYQKTGLIVDYTGSSMTVTNSTITGAGATPLIAQNGIQISRGATASVTDSSISGNECNHASCGTDALDSTSAGLLLFDSGAGTDISNNTISGNDSGIYYTGDAVTISENSLSGNRYAGLYLDDGDATVTANTITGGDASVVSASFDSNTGNSAATLANNVMSASTGEAILVYDENTGDGEVPALVVHNNSITGTGDLVSSTAAVVTDTSANWWGSNSETAINTRMTGSVDFTPFLDSALDTDLPLPAAGFQGDYDTLHVTALGSQSGSTGRVQEGVNLVGDSTVIVGAGTYSEHVVINETLDLLGANSGVDARGSRTAESIIDGGNTGATVQIAADDVKVDGFTIKGGSNGLDAGVYVGIGASSGYQLLNNVITNNSIGVYANCDGSCLIKHNLFNSNNVAGPAGGSGIYAEGTDTLTIEENEFANHTENNPVIFGSTATGAHTDLVFKNNSVHDNVSGVYLVSVHGGNFEGNDISTDGSSLIFGGDDTNITVTKNNLHDGFRGVRVGDDGYGLGANSSITVNLNDITGNSDAGVLVAGYTGNLDATCNWWGAANGPSTVGTGSGDKVSAGVTFAPWLVTSDVNGACGTVAVVGNQGDISVNEGVTATGGGSFNQTDVTISISPALSGFSNDGSGVWSLSHPTTDVMSMTLYTVTATRPNGATATDTFNLTVTNVNPVATFNVDASPWLFSSSGHTISLTSPSDGGNADTFTYKFDCGDGGGYNSPSGTSSRSCTAPSSPGTITVKGTILDDEGGSHEYTQSVTVTQQNIDVDNPSGHDFGNQPSGGGPTAPITFTVTNAGDADLTITGVSMAGANATSFPIDEDNCNGEVLGDGDTCTIKIVFDPTSDGAKNATLRINSNDPNENQVDRALSGNGTSGPTTGSITIVLQAVPDSAQDFSFTGDLGSFLLDDDSNGTLPSFRTFNSLAPDTYDITQGTVSGWSLTDLSCDTGESTSTVTRTATVTLAAGENVTCTFTDSQAAASRPDALISVKSTKKYGGNGIYSSTVLASQTRTKAVPRSALRKLFIRFQQDGPATDSFTVDANVTGSSSYTVQFFSGATNITTAVLNGTYQVSNLSTGQQVQIEMRITAASNTAKAATANVDVSVTSNSQPSQIDVVRGHIKRA